MSVILDNSPSSGSEFGLSFWSRYSGSGCPKREQLSSLLGKAAEDYDSESDLAPLSPLDVGSCFHKLLEHYYGASESMPTIDPAHPAMQEALRLFAGYRERFPAYEFGDKGSVKTEFPIKWGLETIQSYEDLLVHRDKDLQNGVVGYGDFGVPIITGKIDVAAVKVDARALALLSQAPRWLPVAEPGVYLLDHKTMRAKPPANGGDVAMRHRFQFTLYQRLWDLLYSNIYGKCQGFIVNCVVKHKTLTDGSFFSLLVPPPNVEQLMVLKAYLSKCYRNFLTNGEVYTNEESCFSYNRVCPHFTSGACKRY